DDSRGAFSMNPLLRIATMAIACLVSAGAMAADPSPRTVLVLDQSIPYTEYFAKLFKSFQSTWKADSGGPVTIYSESLEYSHFKGPEYDSLLHTFIREKYRSKSIGVIVADGFDALQFAVHLRADLDPGIPSVFCNIHEGAAPLFSLPPNITGTTIKRTIGHAFITARALVPGLRRIA